MTEAEHAAHRKRMTEWRRYCADPTPRTWAAYMLATQRWQEARDA